MKKLLALTLTMAMLFTMTAMATEIAQPANNSKLVKATYSAGTVSDTIYSVDITWGSLEFNYTAAAQGTWNPATHSYDNSGESGSWSYVTGENKVTVTNHSNADVIATVSFDSIVDGVTGSFDNEIIELKTAVNTEYSTAPSGEAKLTLGGNLDESISEVTVGTVTVTIDYSSDGKESIGDNTPTIEKIEITNDSSNCILNITGENLSLLDNSYYTITIYDENDNSKIIDLEKASYQVISETSATISIGYANIGPLTGAPIRVTYEKNTDV